MNFKFFQTEIFAPKGDDVASLVAQTLHENPAIAAKFARKSKEALDNTIKRSMGATGSQLFRGLKSAFRENSLGLEPLAKTASGIAISETIRLNRPFAQKERVTRRRATRAPGGKLWRLMQYRMNFTASTKDLEVGLIPARRGGRDWAEKFSDWQKGGAVDVSRFENYSPASMRAYFRALGIPSSGRVPQRPARPAIERYRQQIRPVELFRQKLSERLNR